MRALQLFTFIAALAVMGAATNDQSIARGDKAATAAARPAADPSSEIREVWIDPVDLEQRDLFRGPDGPPAPQPRAPFAFVKRDTSGASPGYDVRDSNGMVWSVKLGPEAQSEVTSSRILWAIGYHQPPTWYVANWTLTGTDAGPKPSGRFRPELPGTKVVGDWRFEEYPHAQTYQGAGLVVALLMLNDWDLKASNNRLIEIEHPGSGPRRLFVARDIGATLGSNTPNKLSEHLGLRVGIGTKNDLEGFEKSGFIEGVENGYVKFSYRGPHEWLVKHIPPGTVRWTSQLMSRLSDKQWQDAFRAGGYSAEQTTRYVAKLKEKIAAGLALE